MTIEQLIAILKEIINLLENKQKPEARTKPAPAKSKGPKKKVEEPEPEETELDDNGVDDNQASLEDEVDDMSFMEEEEETLSPEDVLKAIHAFIKAQKSVDEGRKKVKALLVKFKAKSVDTLKPENYQAMIDALQVKKTTKK